MEGLINDPHLDGSLDIHQGLSLARTILKDINELGIPCATEFLDPIVPQYISDLVSWVAIGARTTESQTHREMASGLSMPIGFKNATDGSLEVASNAMISAQSPHAFLGIDGLGQTSVVKTKGNQNVHIILRGGSNGPNYDQASINEAVKLLGDRFPPRGVMVDCSHGNSNKDYRRQPEVFKDLMGQFLDGNKSLLGMMLESNLVDGKQGIGGEELVYGKSITDGCISWETTEKLILDAHSQLANR